MEVEERSSRSIRGCRDQSVEVEILIKLRVDPPPLRPSKKSYVREAEYIPSRQSRRREQSKSTRPSEERKDEGSRSRNSGGESVRAEGAGRSFQSRCGCRPCSSKPR